MKIKSCLYYLGLSCFPITIMAFMNIFYSFYFEHLDNISSYVSVLFLSLFVGLVFFYKARKEHESINIYEQLLLVFLIYFLIPIFILIPFYFSSYDVSFVDSYFESISGLTGTGFTIFEHVKSLDPPLILWRSSSQWIGGFYFLIFLVLIFSNKQINFKMIDFSFSLEKKINFSSNLISVTNRIFLIYLSLTVLIFSLFSISGIRLFDSLNLTMTLISSGGFLPTDSLNDIIKSNFQSLFLCIAFLLSILNFYLLYNFILARDNLKKHMEDFFIIALVLVFSTIFYFMNDLNMSSAFIYLQSLLMFLAV